MVERSEVERVAAEIIAEVSREFPAASLELDFEAPRDDHEDAYLWITPGTGDREEINDLWGSIGQLSVPGQPVNAPAPAAMPAAMPAAPAAAPQAGSVYCTQCGAPLPASAKFCNRCGTRTAQ